MLGFSIHRGRMLAGRRRGAAARLALAAFLAVAAALSAAEWRLGLQRDATAAAAGFPLVAVFPLTTDSTDAHFTARQITALYYIAGASVTPAAAALDTLAAAGFAGIIEGNPFPAVARITLRPEFCTPDKITEAATEIRRIAPECEVKFDSALAAETVARLNDISLKSTVSIVFTVALVLLMLYFALRAEHLRDPEERRALAAMGAGRLFMALPHIVFAVISGAAGTAAAAGIRTALGFLPPGFIPLFVMPLWDSFLLVAAVFGIYCVISTATAFGQRK